MLFDHFCLPSPWNRFEHAFFFLDQLWPPPCFTHPPHLTTTLQKSWYTKFWKIRILTSELCSIDLRTKSCRSRISKKPPKFEKKIPKGKFFEGCWLWCSRPPPLASIPGMGRWQDIGKFSTPHLTTTLNNWDGSIAS